MNPCELSAQLLIKLREVLKLYAKSPAGEKYYSRSGGSEFAMVWSINRKYSLILF